MVLSHLQKNMVPIWQRAPEAGKRGADCRAPLYRLNLQLAIEVLRMPIYEYLCTQCGSFTEVQSMANSSQSRPCPICREAADRTITAPHVRTTKASILVRNEERNQRSANKPRVVRKFDNHVEQTGHDANCSHSRHEHERVSHRPWMVGH